MIDKHDIEQMVKEELKKKLTATQLQQIDEGLASGIAKLWTASVVGSAVAGFGGSAGALLGTAIAATGLVNPAVIVPAAAVGALSVFVLGAKLGWNLADRGISKMYGSDSEHIAIQLVEAVKKRDDLLTLSAKDSDPERYARKIEQMTQLQQKLAMKLSKEIDVETRNGTVSMADKQIYSKLIKQASEGKLSYL